MRAHRLEPGQLASFLILTQPGEAYEVALDFLNDSLCTRDREGAVAWTAVLAMVERMQSDSENEPLLLRETRASSMM